MNRLLFITIIFLFNSCVQSSKEPHQTSLDVAANFTISKEPDYTLIEVHQPFVGSRLSERYVLYNRDDKVPEVDNITHFIELPINTVAINSTTHLGYMESINAIDIISAATNLKLYYSPVFKNQIENKNVISIGNGEIDSEKLISAQCDIVFSFAIDAAGMKEVERLRSLGQKVILVAEYMEKYPLGKTSWLSFFASFFDKTDTADSILNQINANYNKIESLASKRKNQVPSVMVGYPWKGSWWVSGGQSFQANYFKSANSNYIWKDKKQQGGVALTFESVITDALEADFWINPGINQSLGQMKNDDRRVTNFQSFNNRMVYGNYEKSNSEGGNDYWESAVVRSDLVLKDLVSIFYPNLLADHELVYFQQLK